jgi:hypothetical protein
LPKRKQLNLEAIRKLAYEKAIGMWTPRCICTLYLKCILNIFKNVKNTKTMFCVYLDMLGLPQGMTNRGFKSCMWFLALVHTIVEGIAIAKY